MNVNIKKRFKNYDAVQLIRLVEARPCIWDRRVDSYRDKFERKNAWEEIFEIMEEDYNSMSSTDKRLVEMHIQRRWWNVRDNFRKSLRDQSRCYVHRKHLHFLVDAKEQKEDEFLPMEYLEEDAEYVTEQTSSSYRKHRKSEDDYTNKRFKKERTSQDTEYDTPNVVDEFNFVDMDESFDASKKQMTEDEAFFASLVPTVARYSEDDKLEFRLGVLNLMKDIRTKNKMMNNDE